MLRQGACHPLLAFGALVLLLVLATRARAAESVSVRIAAPADQVAALTEVLASRLDPLTLDVAPIAAVDPAAALADAPTPDVARVWIAMGEDGAMVILLRGDGERGMARRLPREGASDEVLREELALVIGTAVDTLRQDADALAPAAAIRSELGLPASPEPRLPPPSPAPPSPEPPSHESRSPAPPSPLAAPLAPAPRPTRAPEPPTWRLAGMLFYEAQGFAEGQLIAHGPGAALAIGAPPLTLGPRFELSGQYRLPAAAENAVAGLTLHSGAFRLTTQLTALKTSAVLLRLVAGGGIDLLVIRPFLVDARATLLPSRARVAPVVRFGLDLPIRLNGELSLRIGAGLDVDAIGTRYVIQDGETLVPLLDPLRIRPHLSLGVDTTLAGHAVFSD